MLLTLLNPFAPKAARLPATEAVSRVRKGAVLIDVRNAAEIQASGKAKGALSIPLGEFAHRADPAQPGCDPKVKKADTVLLYCATGSRSAMAGKLMRKYGVSEVYNIGTLTDWQAAGGKVTR